MSPRASSGHSSAPESFHPSAHFCDVCGTLMKAGATYRATDDAGGAVQAFPARECVRCGFVCPDVERIVELPPESIPSSIRIRCARRA